MRIFRLIVLLIAVLSFSIVGCEKDNPGNPSPDGETSSDCCICDINGTDYPICEDDFTTSEYNEIMENNDCDCSSNTAGFSCINDYCYGVTNGAEYNSETECEADCGVTSSGCCLCELDGTEYLACENDYNAAEWQVVLATYDCNCNYNDAGYVCNNGCNGVVNGADYNSLSDCEAICGGSTAGYNCVSGNCQSVSSGALYGTLSECQAVCGGSSSDCCDCTGIGWTCDECCDGEFDMGGESWATWQQIFESSGCNCD